LLLPKVRNEIRRSAALRITPWLLCGAVAFAAGSGLAVAQHPANNDPPQYGPYSGVFLPDGMGIRVPLANAHDSVLLADSPWSLYCWIKTSEPVAARELVAGLGSTTAEYPRYLGLEAGKVTLWMGEGNELAGAVDLKPDEWHLLAATFDGSRFHLYSDGQPVGSGVLTLGSTDAVLQMAPPDLASTGGKHFGGRIASFTVLRRALSDAEVRRVHEARPDFSVIQFEEGSKPWPFQTRGQAGYRAPQDPSTLPTSRASFSLPSVLKRPPVGASLVQTGVGEWTFSNGWRLREAPKVDADGAHLTAPAYDGKDWMRATVPGTVLTTMIDDGVYPDPDYGLNNLAIPESLNKQDYWYRNEFTVPASLQAAASNDARHVELTFQGINYGASVWLNGTLLGTMKGAFRRGTFDVTSPLKAGQKNVLAVRISPPPHPGIPQEQSILGGPGENGGTMELDGPTFLATEGWDWIPAIRDRDSGIWQPVTLTVTRSLKLGDVQVVTSFPNHDTAQAAVEIDVPVTNFSDAAVNATLDASIEQTTVHKSVTLPPGESVVKLAPTEFAQLNLQHPRLWWPNGYGSPELYHLKLSIGDGVAASDTKDVRFGVRDISYELSLLDSSGHLRRVEFSPTAARGSSLPVVDVSHEGMREIPSADAAALNIPEDQRDRYHTHVASLASGAEGSPSIQPVADVRAAPYLVIKVNGVRIAARGGNWGMDDARKRVSRAHLEPYFLLNRDANLNIIRNWVGQSTEETFYNLADEYGMLVWNDFWESTQNYNIEAEDPVLFLANASDTIKHFRNHPSIVVWCGRNEGVPQPILNAGLDELVRRLDGTRYYSPSSNQVNLQGSGPYSYQNPALYYSSLNRGFSVETGTPSMSTLESFQSTIAKDDQWPISDAWAYHDWHQSGNGDVASFMAEIQAEFGAPTGLEDFERKAQMLNYVDHRAIFEGMNANLWAPNSGRMLWMTQPAWPSTMWQILSSDYDTQASFYGTMKACEPVHVQLNLATYQVDVINTTTTARTGLTVGAKVYSLANALLFQATEHKDVSADSSSGSLKLDLAPYLAQGMVIVELELQDAAGRIVSQNLYWLGAKSSSYRELTHLAPTSLKMEASATRSGGMVTVKLQLTNPGTIVSLANKLTLIAAKDGTRILPAYFSDNYISLLPGETRSVEVQYPADAVKGVSEISLRGWNATPQTVPVKTQN
jgi:Exo-beta-D-glucosaminidase Ig-fold domain/Concanavalin A-like lectin/glucanases superfamily/Glycosyl hydrolases family 2/Glycosyl hydrolases family 2, TIM barrel domain/Glycosyl hydrolases family 2, sugar binding domain